MTTRSGRSGGSHALTQRDNLGPAPFSKTRAVKRGSGNSQADHRREHHMTDQHGRAWSCSVELRSGMPTGLITNDFNAPWLPDQNALVVNPNDTSELWIDYGLMWRERLQALSAYHKNAVSLAADKTWPIPTKGVYSNDFRRILGDPPKPLQPVKAAAQGNSWILGETDIVDERLYEYVVAIEDRDADLDDGEDYSPEGFARQVDGRGEAPDGDAVVLAGRAAAFTPPLLDLDEMEDETVGDYTVDTGSYEEEPELPAEDDESALSVLDDEHDDGLSGRTVQPQKTAIAERQAPRRPGSTATRHKKGKARGSKGRTMVSLRQRQAARGVTQPTGATLADGAKPAVGRAVANETLVRHASET